jgi:hypothetical protein
MDHATLGEIAARFSTVHGAEVTVTRNRLPGSTSSEFWACACGSAGRLSFDPNQVRAAANDHARTCLVIPLGPGS